jgi:hypothetical protein
VNAVLTMSSKKKGAGMESPADDVLGRPGGDIRIPLPSLHGLSPRTHRGSEPLLIVLLFPLILSGYALRPRHIIGALAGLAGAALIVTGGSLSLYMAGLPGYAAAAGQRWSGRSIPFSRSVSRRLEAARLAASA